MIDREWLEEFATGKPSDADVATLREAVLRAINIANDDVEGDDEHVVFVAALVAALGLQRSTGAPRISRFDGDLATLRRWAGRHLSHSIMAKTLAVPGVISQSTIRNRLRALDAEATNRRLRLMQLLKSDAAACGKNMLVAAIARDRR